MSQSSSAYRALLWRTVQIICTVALIIILWHSADWTTFQVILKDLHWRFVVFAVLSLLLAHVINIVRWACLLRPSRIPPTALVAFYGAGLFSNNFLPSGIGGDAVRAALVAPHVGWSKALLSVVLDRGIGLLGLAFFILPGLWLGLPDTIARLVESKSRELTNQPFVAIAGLAIVAVMVGGAIYYYGPRIWHARLHSLQGNGEEFAVQWSRYEYFGIISRTFIFSVLSNLGTIVAHWAMLKALNITISPGAAIWLVIMSAISMLIPLSINGLGLIESVFVIVLMAYHVPSTPALAVALLSRALFIFYSLLGGALSLRLRWWELGRSATALAGYGMPRKE